MSAAQILDFRRRALTTCAAGNLACMRPTQTRSDGSSIRLPSGLITPHPIITTDRVGPMTWETPILPDSLPPALAHPGVGLYVDGRFLKLRSGNIVQWRGIEGLWGPTSAGNVATAVAAIRGFGANAMGPIFQVAQATATNVRAVIGAAEALGMMVGVNADAFAAPTGRSWLTQSDIVLECNAGRGVILQCEVELGVGMTAGEWRDAATLFVLQLRAAGHLSPIKVGSPGGGRRPSFALQMGSQVLAADPLRSLIFTWQAYWAEATGGFQYSQAEGFPSGGTAGALECADALRNSGLCWIVGLDGADDVGNTPYITLASRLHEYGIAWQWWAMFVGDAYGNGLTDNLLTSTPKLPFGFIVQGILQSQAQAVVYA